LHKKWRQEKEFFFKKGQANPIQASTRGWRATVGLRPVADRRLDRVGLSFSFLFKFILILIFLKFGEWARAFGRMGAKYIHFFKLPPTLGSVKSSIRHRIWRFYFILFYFP
jgi:hypothetical protein